MSEIAVTNNPFSTHDGVVAFGFVLHRCHVITDVATMLFYMEKPWKWAAEYQGFQELGGKLNEETINAMFRRFG